MGLEKTKDHVIPVSKGGKKQNIVPACVLCNCSKTNNEITKWYVRQPTFSQDRMERIKQWQELT